MKTTLLLLALFSMLTLSVSADEDTPVPPEVQKLVETMVAALKGADDAALLACWHPAEVMGKVKFAEATAEGDDDPAKEQEREAKRQTRNLEASKNRAGQIRSLVSKHFGELAQLTLTRVEVSEDDEATAEMPKYDNVEVRLKAADGTQLNINLDDVLKIDGVWKFRGRLEDDLTIELPEVD